MESFATNVVVRLLVDDDSVQSPRAVELWRQAIRRGGVFLSKVLVETVWVLKTAYRFDREAIVKVLDAMMRTGGVSVEQEEQISAALQAYACGAADFSDYLILTTAREHRALPVHSFDRRFAKAEGVGLVRATSPFTT
uniref:Predicted nucleic-acid-binding protein, contains PIN domain n=1 Tax=Candidatus Kentrum sp. FW TaxID=2126338 RepID=A0A450TMG0_9GAMM|nr:MAG: Predicted nucleic-acid-binding protein, contains PIN domain [Candidatus Kentron sp. FW]